MVPVNARYQRKITRPGNCRYRVAPMPIPAIMKAMRLHWPGQSLALDELPLPRPSESQVLLQVLVCGVCRTDLHLLEGELPDIHYPITPGHEIVGRVIGAGDAVTRFHVGDRIGVPWLGQT